MHSFILTSYVPTCVCYFDAINNTCQVFLTSLDLPAGINAYGLTCSFHSYSFMLIYVQQNNVNFEK